jgi:hypothetical protein
MLEKKLSTLSKNVIPLRLVKMSYLWKFMNYGLIVFVQIEPRFVFSKGD